MCGVSGNRGIYQTLWSKLSYPNSVVSRFTISILHKRNVFFFFWRNSWHHTSMFLYLETRYTLLNILLEYLFHTLGRILREMLWLTVIIYTWKMSKGTRINMQLVRQASNSLFSNIFGSTISPKDNNIKDNNNNTKTS